MNHARKEQTMRKPALGAILLGSIPFAALCFSVPLWDRVRPMILGLPFNLFWLILWIPLTTLCMWGAYKWDNHSQTHKEHRSKDVTR